MSAVEPDCLSGGALLRCHYCRRGLEPPKSPSRVAFTRDHIMPKTLGGRKTVPCCRQCNHLKADLHPAEWELFMRDNPEWWQRPEFQRGTLARVPMAGSSWARYSRRRRSPLAPLYAREGGLCFWCDRLTTMASHVEAEALPTAAMPDRIDGDGPIHLHNLVLACRRCQDLRAGRDFDAFLEVAVALFADAEPAEAKPSSDIQTVDFEQLDLSRFPAWWVRAVRRPSLAPRVLFVPITSKEGPAS